MLEGAPTAQLVMIILHDPAYLNDLLAALLEAGITNATVVESQGMGRLLSRDMPIFASFRHMFAGSKSYAYTVFAPVEDARVTEHVVALAQDVLRDAPPSDRGLVLALPVARYVDLSEPTGGP